MNLSILDRCLARVCAACVVAGMALLATGCTPQEHLSACEMETFRPAGDAWAEVPCLPYLPENIG